MSELCAPVNLPSAPAVHSKSQRHLALKTLSLPQERVGKLTRSASPACPTPTTELLNSLDENPLRILIAPSGFKESLGPERIAIAIEDGVRRVLDRKAVIVQKLPLHDGGEGFARALVAVQGGDIMENTVIGPIGLPIDSHLGFIGEDRKTAILDIAAAAGLRLVPQNCRDPTVTTTYGVGQLMKKALEAGCTKIIVGCGDSGTSDGGAGMLQALGARLLDADGKELPLAAGGQSLSRLDSVCWENIHPRLRESSIQIEAVCNIKNVLCGPKGVARVYGPQKGATPEQVDPLATALECLAKVAEVTLGKDISCAPGSGASGGLGAGLMMLGARLRARADAIDEYFEFDRILGQQWDFVITAEGILDLQSTEGKMTTEVARRAKRSGAQVVALAGSIGAGAELVHGAGIQAFTSILKEPLTLEEAIMQTETLVMDGAEKVLRMIMVGLALGRSHF